MYRTISLALEKGKYSVISRKQPPQKFEEVVVTRAGPFREWALSTSWSRVSGTPCSPHASVRLPEKGEKNNAGYAGYFKKTIEGGRLRELQKLILK